MTRDDIRTMLRTNPRALARGVVAIYRRQLADERNAQATMHDNGVGFNAADARILSQIAQTIIAQGWDGFDWDTTDYAEALERMPKYAGQLLEIATSRSLGI